MSSQNTGDDKIGLVYLSLSHSVIYTLGLKGHDIGVIQRAISRAVGFISPIIIDTTTSFIKLSFFNDIALQQFIRIFIHVCGVRLISTRPPTLSRGWK